MKQDYEDAFRLVLPRRSYVVVRIDGRGFHTFARDLERPYSRRLADALDQAAMLLCQEMIGCRFAYGQSDEYSFLLTDFEKENAPLWFDGNVQKIVSVSASLFTGRFNRIFNGKIPLTPERQIIVAMKLADTHNSSVHNGYTHGVYYTPSHLPFVSHYMHSRKSEELALADAMQLVEIDDSGEYYVVDYRTGRTIFRSKNGQQTIGSDPSI